MLPIVSADPKPRYTFLIACFNRGNVNCGRGRHLSVGFDEEELKSARKFTPIEKVNHMERVFQSMSPTNVARALHREMSCVSVGHPVYDFCKQALSAIGMT